jgi:hypothetical protein
VAHTLVSIDCRRITDWDSFFDVFSEALGFPGFFGRNMNAWIDCLSSADAPDDGLTGIHAPPGGILVLQLEHMNDFATRCPEIQTALVECSAFVNWRRIEVGDSPVLALSFHQ